MSAENAARHLWFLFCLALAVAVGCSDGNLGGQLQSGCRSADDCNANAFCDEGTCVCNEGYAGSDCEVCADGYFGDSCTACTCVHGACNDGLVGDGTCVCDYGWSGPSCEECASGHYGADCLPCDGCNPPDTCVEECVECLADGECTSSDGQLPRMIVIFDYSTSMNTLVDEHTRFEKVLYDLQAEAQKNNTFLHAAKLSLIRFGHDPAPNSAGTTIPGELTGITDGQAVDVTWTDEAFTCGAAAVLYSLAITVYPMDGNLSGIGTWTKGAMDRAAGMIAEDRAAFPVYASTRRYVILVITDGAWSGPDGTTLLSPADADPGITAADLYTNQGIETWVVEISADPGSRAAANDLAAAGGTGQAYGSVSEVQQQLGSWCD